MTPLRTHLLLWFPLMFIAIANGAARDLLYRPPLGELRAHQLSTATLLLLFALYFRFIFARWRLPSAGRALTVGLLWLLMTIAFEFGFGRLAAHKPWPELLREYDLAAGRVWVVIPLWVAAAPLLFCRRRRGAR